LFKEEIISRPQEKKSEVNSHLWGIILAGGEGNRLQSYVEKIYGYPRPKQYCVLTGTRSLLEHTFDRALKIYSPEHLVLIANRSHTPFVCEERFQKIQNVLFQPCGRETTAGILLPILKIFHQDPEAIISIFPSDQFIEQESLFMHYIDDANNFVNANPEAIVMLGVRVNKPESGCGWIEPSDAMQFKPGRTIYRVKKFWEKPESKLLHTLCNQGCLCNTFVLTGKASSFISNIQNYTPDVFEHFAAIYRSLGTPFESLVIQNIFPRIPMRNFSHEVLEKITDNLYVLEVKGVNWSDWGEEDRVIRDIDRLQMKRTMNDSAIKNKSIKKRIESTNRIYA